MFPEKNPSGKKKEKALRRARQQNPGAGKVVIEGDISAWKAGAEEDCQAQKLKAPHSQD